jgi:uncharacterized protein YqfA (UPF0365 family)
VRSGNESHAQGICSMDATQIVLLVLGAFVGLFFLVFMWLLLPLFPTWIRSMTSGGKISPMKLVLMRLMKINPQVVVQARIMAVQANLTDVSTSNLEAHYLAGGNILRVVQALIAATRARLGLTWDTAAAIDLAGRDVLDAVRTSVDPKVIDCPDPSRHGRTTLDGVAKNGIQLKARARVTVRTNLSQLVGGATEETVIARVGEGIVSAIGSCDSHERVLEQPMLIARTVLDKGLDSQTAFEIVSIDIADIDVGENVGARLQADQAEADMRVARAKAEERRAQAVAQEQEMKAETVENRAEVVLAEADVPKAMASAFEQGNLRAEDSM